MANRRYVVLTIEAAIEIDQNLGNNIQSALDSIRETGAARAVNFTILNGEEAYQDWYKDPARIQEVEVPEVTITRFEWD